MRIEHESGFRRNIPLMCSGSSASFLMEYRDVKSKQFLL